MNKEIEVNQSTAEFFMDQCIGQHTGHMAMIPNNPTLFSLTRMHTTAILGEKRQMDRLQFAKFCRGVADQLEKDQDKF